MVLLFQVEPSLHLQLRFDIKKGDEIITTPITFAATAASAMYQGASVKLVDIDLQTLNIDQTKLVDNINNKKKVIMPVILEDTRLLCLKLKKL